MPTKAFLSGDLVTTGTTAETQLVCTNAPGYNATDEDGHDVVTFFVKIIAGASGVQFGVGVGSISSASYANPVGEYFPIEGRNGNIVVKQSVAGDTYRITACKPG